MSTEVTSSFFYIINLYKIQALIMVMRVGFFIVIRRNIIFIEVIKDTMVSIVKGSKLDRQIGR